MNRAVNDLQLQIDMKKVLNRSTIEQRFVYALEQRKHSWLRNETNRKEVTQLMFPEKNTDQHGHSVILFFPVISI